MEVCEHLDALSEVFLARRSEEPSPKVVVDLRLRPGEPKAWTTKHGRAFAHHVAADPDQVAKAWSVLDVQTLSGAIVLEAELISHMPGLGKIFRWVGVEQQSPVQRYRSTRYARPRVAIVEGFVTVVRGASVPDVRLCAATEKLTVRYARNYLERVPETDWNTVDIWIPKHGRPDTEFVGSKSLGIPSLYAEQPMTGVTDVRLNAKGHVLLHGRREVPVRLRDCKGIWTVRPDATWIEPADDGCLVRVGDLDLYYAWREQEAEKRRPKTMPIAAEDEDALAGVIA